MKFVIAIFILFFILVSCSVSMQESKIDPNQPKPITITRCDMMGWDSASIIAKEKERGYRFTGSTRGWVCYNDLHFELIDKEPQ